ncbi:AraC family transcriptional regulator [Paenibacillus chitinolyticus]|uniref:helix-turn-helix transcriptional regulator n=1 Tax=Paenibacillus chitinolyticus TaxID=79263 RepID=UPI002DBF54C2|nr:AraC family transcriptional regulator [Paenibacillus chitinolyticus]MEC0246741.1 AraC family transcriptional regulator [Paenibacillus chitinolyticus]
MDVLIIITHTLGADDHKKIAHLFRDMEIIAESRFTNVVQLIGENPHDLVVFLSFEDALPPDWKLDELEMEAPMMILLNVNKLDLFLCQTFLDSIGLLPKPASDVVQETTIHPLLYKSLLFIEENIQENDLSLEKVASYIYVSRCHYSRLFKEHFGTGFKEYIMNKRIQKAKLMLQEGQPVTDVCYSVGYGDLTHFGRVFKRLVGVNPSVYRRTRGKAAGE